MACCSGRRVRTRWRGDCGFQGKAGDGDLKHIRYLFVDEYQDFTELFHQLIAALRAVNPGVRLFCVGDDWQAINRFAGSDLKFYREFDRIFPLARRLQLTTNRRSKRSIVQASNALMSGRGSACQGSHGRARFVAVVDLAKFSPTSLEESIFKRSLLTPVVLRLAGAALAAGKSVVLLSARNVLSDPGGGAISLDRYLKALRDRLPSSVRHRLTVSTAHGYKGSQCDVVIVMDATATNYPLIHPNWVFSRVLGESEAEIVNESRRLFYVALTRAKDTLFVLTESGRRSPYLNDMSKRLSLPDVDWSKFPPILPDDGWLVVKVLGDYAAIQPLIPGLKADSFRYRDLSRAGGDRTWDRAYRTTDLTVDFLNGSPWMRQAEALAVVGISVQFFDGLEKLRAAGEIVGGKLLMTSDKGAVTEFDLSQLRLTLAVGQAPSGIDLTSALNT
jgi:DNA helicase-4